MAALSAHCRAKKIERQTDRQRERDRESERHRQTDRKRQTDRQRKRKEGITALFQSTFGPACLRKKKKR